MSLVLRHYRRFPVVSPVTYEHWFRGRVSPGISLWLAALRHPATPARRCMLAQSETDDAQTDLGSRGDCAMSERRSVRGGNVGHGGEGAGSSS